ncbi:phosphotransferase [Actinospica durhamensis]|uniref:Phosphotransferase n=1 Tax=Actinospica durhamensis TaxID=1508375 RepID=A0A941INA5_9ACTN|nr:phosphotransferase [Actinospica durhamensis]MBR7831807.1 phosphotransferase [Actinospica durhamensis]
MTVTAPHLVHGMGTEEVAPDWPALTAEEVAAVLRAYPEASGRDVRLAWLSPRPLSAAALVSCGGGGGAAEFFVKRHHASVRTAASLREEHRFLRHLKSRGAPVVHVLADGDGRTVVQRDVWNYEVHTVGVGHDLYRDAISWSPFAQPDHAYAAGEALARLHQAAAGFHAPHREPAPLIAGFSVFAAADPLAAVEAYAAERPAVAAELDGRPGWREDLTRWHLPFHQRLRPWLADLESSWVHGDFHASNLLWRDGRVSSVIDFSLCDRAYAVHDLATAIERNAVEWIELDAKGAAAVHLDTARALIAGYRHVRELSPAERAALPELLPLCHVDYALSEIDYFHGVTGSASNTELAYRYLVDHTAWFAGPDGSALLATIREELAR